MVLLDPVWSSICPLCSKSSTLWRLKVSTQSAIRPPDRSSLPFYLDITGLKCADRLFVSDQAHLVLGFHQIVDGLKEIELGGSSIGTTKKGIGPAYSSKASRSGLRVHHLYDPETFAQKFRKLVEGRFKRYGHFEYDTEGEIKKYQVRIHLLFAVFFQLEGNPNPVPFPCLPSAGSRRSSSSTHR